MYHLIKDQMNPDMIYPIIYNDVFRGLLSMNSYEFLNHWEFPKK
jgi:hypothetical protein